MVNGKKLSQVEIPVPVEPSIVHICELNCHSQILLYKL